MNIAGLDIATTTGLAVMREDGSVVTQTFKGAPKKKKFLDHPNKEKSLSLNVEGDIGHRFREFLLCWLLDNRIEYVAIELPISTSTTRIKEEIDFEANFAGNARRRVQVGGTSMATIFRLHGLQMIAAEVCKSINIPVIEVAQGTWRKFFIDTGRHPKAKDMAVQKCRSLGIEISSIDSAEAVGIVMWLDQKLNPYSQRKGDDLFSIEKRVPTPEELNQRTN